MRTEELQLHAIDENNLESLIGANLEEIHVLKNYDGILKKIMIRFDNDVYMFLGINQENNRNLDILCFREREEDYVKKFFKSHRGRVEKWNILWEFDYLKFQNYWIMQNNFGDTDRLQIHFDSENNEYFLQQFSVIKDRLRLYRIFDIY